MAQITEMHVIIKLFIYLFLSEPKSFLRKVFCTLQRSFFFFAVGCHYSFALPFTHTPLSEYGHAFGMITFLDIS